MRPEIEKLLARRVALITGKGGVGRSTATAALAKVAARRGKRVLLVELAEEGGDYSPLATLFGRERLPDKASELVPGIDGASLLSRVGQELFLASVLRTATLARAALSSEALRRLLDAAPSFREMGYFFHLLTYIRARRDDGAPLYDLILVDMPATGHALALAGLPEILLKVITRGPIAEGLREGQTFIRDPALTAAYVVTIPETLPVSEALELAEGLEKVGIHVGGVFLNRMLENPFTADERRQVEQWLAAGERRQGFAAAEKIFEAGAAAERLRASSPLPVVPLPQCAPGQDPTAVLAEVLNS